MLSIQKMVPLISAALCLACLPARADTHQPETSIVRTNLAESNCEIADSVNAAGALVFTCTGEGGWTLFLHDYLNQMTLSLENEAGANSGEMRFDQRGSDGELGQRIEWVYAGETLLGLTVGYSETPLAGEANGAYNVYSIAIKPDQTPSACVMSRVEFGRVRGVTSAARQVITSMADGWDCAEDQRIDFSPETINGQPYSQAVRESARARSGN
ncbi:hypothetical protein [Ponticaulis sp.]|uniref:hypothetical protein n=1 Tax=Ponticaulis sp. TaxID=2020902 RepID=UPI000C45E10B|nr:hypothetical protein [Ponticaulis sp.]MAJ10490.1 hypothetical protein [Ponticaulis sp.]HBH89459.1 hypothetical protein [Hyphomonadaceae bacterium]|tara:strand:- start:18258 stop:18899 length:642 start_codon:yes stop_codon:yes gene_type:complete